MKYLLKHKIDSFISFVHKLELHKWNIMDKSIGERYKIMKEKDSLKELKKLAKERGIKHNYREIISWMDNLYIMYKCLSNLPSKTNIDVKTLDVIAEYKIPYTMHRIDYMITMDNKILLIEFSFADNKSRNERFQNKLNQVICYKELLYGILPNHIKISTYTFIITPTIDECYEIIEDNYLEEQIENLSNFIYDYFSTTNKSAIEELEKF